MCQLRKKNNVHYRRRYHAIIYESGQACDVHAALKWYNNHQPSALFVDQSETRNERVPKRIVNVLITLT